MTRRSFQYIAFAFALSSVLLAREVPAGEDLGQGYSREGKYILFEGRRTNYVKVPLRIKILARIFNRKLPECTKVDAASFQVLSKEYTRDKNKVYYNRYNSEGSCLIELTEADAASFEVIGSYLARDKNYVWRKDSVVPGADVATVKLVRDSRVWKDAQSVWYQRKRIAGADPKTFRHLGSGYYIDAKRAYWGSTPIYGADLDSFKVLGNSFIAIDQNMVYHGDQRLPHIDVKTCKLIPHNPSSHQVISDKNGVYLNKFKFLHADPADFKMIDNLTGRGGKYVFLVDTWHSTPVTVYREGGRLVTETILYEYNILYEKGTVNALAVIKAVVVDDRLEDVTLSPAPGKSVVKPVPDWQIELFQREGMVERIKAAGKLLQ